MPPAKKSAKPVIVKYVMDCSIPAGDNILDPSGLEKFFVDRIKVDGKTGNFESRTNKNLKLITVSRDKTRVTVDAVLPFRKSYLKFLTKKYLKKQQIRDFVRVIATNPTTYSLKYFNQKSQAADEA